MTYCAQSKNDRGDCAPLSRHLTQVAESRISSRCEHGGIIVTPNKSYGERGSIFGDPIIATAILDRAAASCDRSLREGDSSTRTELRQRPGFRASDEGQFHSSFLMKARTMVMG